MLLASRTFATGDVRTVRVSFRDFLDRGVTIVTAAVTFPAGTVSTVSSCTLSPDGRWFHFVVTCAPAAETFVAAVAVTTTRGDVINDNIDFNIVNPFSV